MDLLRILKEVKDQVEAHEVDTVVMWLTGHGGIVAARGPLL